MMPSREEIERALWGAWLLLRRDPAAFAQFDLSVEGFWRSFFAAVLAAPAYAVLVVDQHMLRGTDAGVGALAASEVLAYGLGWVHFPLVALFLTRWFDLTDRYVPLIVASNWAAVLQVAFFLGVLAFSKLMPPALAAVLLTAATLAVLTYQWLVIRISLESTPGLALGFLVADMVASWIINLLIDLAFQSG